MVKNVEIWLNIFIFNDMILVFYVREEKLCGKKVNIRYKRDEQLAY